MSNPPQQLLPTPHNVLEGHHNGLVLTLWNFSEALYHTIAVGGVLNSNFCIIIFFLVLLNGQTFAICKGT